jgi:protein-L-isoaspartate(D-aspartate) O-methyltransferase
VNCGVKDLTTLRHKMVEELKAKGIRDEVVLKAMLKVPRHEFVLPKYKKYAYNDYPLPIGFGQTISQPYIVALMTELLALKPQDKVLEIGTGSGYHAAILAEIAKKVYTIEIIPELSQRAKSIISKLGYKNINFKIGDGYIGWEEYAPFDAIIVTCAPEKIPEPLIKQLKEGGRMVIPVGGEWIQDLILLTKQKGKLTQRVVTKVRFVPMLGEHTKIPVPLYK